MSTICLCVKIHIPVIMRNYRFFEINHSDKYYDDQSVDFHLNRIYCDNLLPFFDTVRKLFSESDGRFKVAISISGITLKLLQNFVPQAIDSIAELVRTGCIEFLSEPWAHSLVAFSDPETLRMQTLLHDLEIRRLFGKSPQVFMVNSPFCSGKIMSSVPGDGEGVFIGRKGNENIKTKNQTNFPNNSGININPVISQILQNLDFHPERQIRINLAFAMLKQINNELKRENPLIISYNVAMNPRPFNQNCAITFITLMKLMIAFSEIKIEFPSEMIRISGHLIIKNNFYRITNDHQFDLPSDNWLANDLQKEAFKKQSAIQKLMQTCKNPSLIQDWNLIQDADHIHYMDNLFFYKEYGEYHFNPYPSPYLAFINYMNVLADLANRIGKKPLPIKLAHVPFKGTTVRKSTFKKKDFSSVNAIDLKVFKI